jgi:hypothetical protein
MTPLSYVTSGRQTIGSILKRGKTGFEAFDSAEKSLPEGANSGMQ